MITKYPTWVEEQLKIIDEIIMSKYDVKVPPYQMEDYLRAVREQIKPLIAEKVRLIANSSCAYIVHADELSDEWKEKIRKETQE